VSKWKKILQRATFSLAFFFPLVLKTQLCSDFQETVRERCLSTYGGGLAGELKQPTMFVGWTASSVYQVPESLT